MASKPTQLARTRELHVDMTLAGHEPVYFSTSDGRRSEDKSGPVICYFPDGQQMISGSGDKTTRLWDLRTGKESKEVRVMNEHEVHAAAVSRDGRWVITAGDGGELKACEVKTGIVKIFEGHLGMITCIDISVDSKLLASASYDGTARIWSLNTGKLVAGPFNLKCGQFSCAGIRFSRNSKKFVVTSWPNTGKGVEMWDIEAQRMIVRAVRDLFYYAALHWRGVFWTMEDRTIIVSFTHWRDGDGTYTISELDASTLGNVGAPFKGHTDHIMCFELSFDCAFLVSASNDRTIKFWAFHSRQLIASFNSHSPPYTCALSPDARKVAYTVIGDAPHKIYIYDIPPNILADIWPHKEATRTNPRSNALDSDATTPPSAVRHNQAMLSSATQPLSHSSATPRHQLSVLRHLRKLLPSSFYAGTLPIAHTIDPCDPLDCPATSPRLLSQLSPSPFTTPAHPNPGKDSSPIPALPVSLAPTSTFGSRLRQLSNWWPFRTGNPLPPIVDVALAPGQLRHAAAGGRTSGIRSVSDEDVSSHSPQASPSLHSQQPPAGEHGRGPLCGCF